MTTVKHPHSKSTAAKIRRLILRGMTNKDIVDKLTCSYGYVSTIRSKMKTQSTVTAPPGDMSEMVYQISRGRGRPRKDALVTAHRTAVANGVGKMQHIATFLPDHELAEAMSKVEDDRVERKHLKQSFMAVVAMAVLLASVLAYTFAFAK
jgi:hypothetical protein